MIPASARCADKLACIALLPADQLAGYERWLRTDTSPGRRDPLPGEIAAIMSRQNELNPKASKPKHRSR